MGLFASTIVVLAVASLISFPIVKRARRRGFYFGAAMLGAVFLITLTQFPTILASDAVFEGGPWIPELFLHLSLRIDSLSYSLALLVSGAGALIMLYARWYFTDDDPGLARFSTVFLGFAASMLGLVLADDVYLLFIFWECTSVFSFLLIGHQHRSRIARSAAIQALVVTVLGGLVMFVGFVLLTVHTGTSSLFAMTSEPPEPALLTTVAVFCVLVGALSKSAIFPFHFWLPAAMAAPTPVSAYLHAAAMVKAGVYLIARTVPGFAEYPGFKETIVVLGGVTMVWGAVRALRQFDIKLIVAHGTVSQLGMLVMLFGVGNVFVSVTGFLLLFAHAIAKAPLFLSVGVIDHRTGTRDLRSLSGLGKQAPVLTTVVVLASLSMAGIPVLFGFVAKEAALATLLEQVQGGDWLLVFILAAFVIGSTITVAYMARFVWGALASKRGVDASSIVHEQSRGIMVAPMVFTAVALIAGIFGTVVGPWFARIGGVPATDVDLALWHGFTPALMITAGMIASGLFLSWLVTKVEAKLPHVPERLSAAHGYWQLTYWLDLLAVRVTSVTQRGSLPFYLAITLSVVVVSLGVLLWIPDTWPTEIVWMTSLAQLPIAVMMVFAAIRAAQAETRFKAVVLVGATGYGLVAIFALHGAPDLAITQALVETVTLIAVILVIRRLPIKIKAGAPARVKMIRLLLSSLFALGIGTVALIAVSARTTIPISDFLGPLAVSGGHGVNIVNVTLVDIRGWDTMGELSVVIAAATGVASLVFLSTRGDNLPKLSRQDARTNVRRHLRKVADPNDPTQQMQWLLAGYELDPDRRSIVLEVIVRLIFHALIIVSIYLLLAGHNSPGGGFAGGLVAGLALVARYLAGGRHELGATVTLDAGRILGIGLALATLTALVPLFFGQQALASTWFDIDLGIFGEISFVTSTVFDIGVYFVVLGLILDVLRSLGAEIDEHEEADAKIARQEHTS